ncbi:cytochrome P450 [Meredithblackwellia eburnea MCA 4105]
MVYHTLSLNESLVFVAGAIAILLLARHLSQRRRLPLPPGPKGHPLVGSAFSLDPGRPWIQISHWAKDYGPFFLFWTFGTPVIVIADLDIAKDLLEKRGAIYSDRPRLVMADEIISDRMNPTLARNVHGGVKRFRRVMSEQLRLSEVRAHAYPVQKMEARKLVKNVLEKPRGFIEAIDHFATSIMLSTTYKHPITANSPADKALVHQIVKSTQRFFGAFIAGAYVVDLIPALKYLPSFFPGMAWKRDGIAWQKEDTQMYKHLWDAAELSPSGTDEACFVNRMVSRDMYGMTRKEASFLAGALLAAGSDTTSASLTILIICMMYHPDALKKAQEEVDRVVGRDRMPTFEDLDELHFIQATIREGSRWLHAAPVGIPHRLEQEDEYRGYRLPKGATVIAAISLCNHNPAHFPNPDKFLPERFLDPATGKFVEQPTAGFGFGRRTCPGKYLAEASLFIGWSSLLWAFDFAPVLDGRGEQVLPTLDPAKWSASAASFPPKFPCEFRVRHEGVEEVLKDSLAEM